MSDTFIIFSKTFSKEHKNDRFGQSETITEIKKDHIRTVYRRRTIPNRCLGVFDIDVSPLSKGIWRGVQRVSARMKPPTFSNRSVVKGRSKLTDGFGHEVSPTNYTGRETKRSRDLKTPKM